MISKDVVKKFLESKEAVKPCEACHHSSWTIPSDENESTLSITCDLHIAQVDGNVRIPSPAVPVIIIACTYCGHIRLFSSNMIKKEI